MFAHLVRQNKRIFEPSAMSLDLQLEWKLISDWLLEAQLHSSHLLIQPTVIPLSTRFWSPPPPRIYKINIDALIREGFGLYRSGWYDKRLPGLGGGSFCKTD
ncbi:hypothetical protein Syun_017213 [Stephania yunnanensis]|uniref:Uncharacterized protein n=1 Tax=Stephania yunnanensis TaxID=152371 RepID=A0AAP0J8S3_9MAGN